MSFPAHDRFFCPFEPCFKCETSNTLLLYKRRRCHDEVYWQFHWVLVQLLLHISSDLYPRSAAPSAASSTSIMSSSSPPGVVGRLARHWRCASRASEGWWRRCHWAPCLLPRPSVAWRGMVVSLVWRVHASTSSTVLLPLLATLVSSSSLLLLRQVPRYVVGLAAAAAVLWSTPA